MQERAPTGIITADAPQLPPPEREALERAATIRAALEPPKTFDAHYLQGNAFYAVGDYEKALQEYNRSLELRPDDPGALSNRGNSLDHLKRYDEALADHNRSLELRPDDPGTLNNRGVTLQHLQRYDEALAEYNRSLELRPDHPTVIYNMACTLSLMERWEESLQQLEKAIAGDERYRQMARDDEDFANLRSDPTHGPEFRRLVGEPAAGAEQ